MIRGGKEKKIEILLRIVILGNFFPKQGHLSHMELVIFMNM